MRALLVQWLAHAAAVIFHEGTLHHELNLPIDEGGAALFGALNAKTEICMKSCHVGAVGGDAERSAGGSVEVTANAM
jgi:hypothetical protein